MPTYEYRHNDKNTSCSLGYVYELFEKISEKPQEICVVCMQPVQRLIGSGAGIIFKGKGFYATDYRKDSGKSESNPSK